MYMLVSQHVQCTIMVCNRLLWLFQCTSIKSTWFKVSSKLVFIKIFSMWVHPKFSCIQMLWYISFLYLGTSWTLNPLMIVFFFKPLNVVVSSFVPKQHFHLLDLWNIFMCDAEWIILLFFRLSSPPSIAYFFFFYKSIMWH